MSNDSESGFYLGEPSKHERKDIEKGENQEGGENVNIKYIYKIETEGEEEEKNDLFFGDEDLSSECCCCTRYKFKISVLFLLFMISSLILGYILAVGLLNFVFYPQVYQWISLFEKSSSVHICFTIFGLISDFGYSYFLFLMAFVIVDGFMDKAIKQILGIKKLFIDGKRKIKLCFVVTYIIFTIIFSILSILCFTLDYGVFFLLVISLPSMFCCVSCVGICNVCDAYKDENDDEDQKELGIRSMFPLMEDFYITNVANRHNTDKEKCSSRQFYVPTFLFITMGQIYMMVVAGMKYNEVGSTERAGIVIGIIIRIFMLPKLFDFNLFDSIVNFKRTMYIIRSNKVIPPEDFRKIPRFIKENDGIETEDFKEELDVFYAMMKFKELYGKESSKKFTSFIVAAFLFIAGLISAIVLAIYVSKKEMPNVTSLSYKENTTKWERNKVGTSLSTKPFCDISSDLAKSMHSDDIAMLTVLPRLYKVHNGKCFIKPKLRGVFSSTMKYIFGQDYEDHNITIMCYTRTQFPYLVISSGKFTKELIDQYDPSDITILPEQFSANSSDFFSVPNPLNNNLAKDELKKLQSCLAKGEVCDEEWEEYINEYWESYDIDSNEQLPGLEQYQINVEDDVVIQPSFITKNGDKLSSTHFIVGGGFENKFGYGFLMENTIRVYLPYVLENFIPLYSWATSLFRDSLNRFTKFTYYFLYSEYLAGSEIRELSRLIAKFNMSNDALFMVGHSISGATIKEMSYITDIKGIVLEASNGRGIASSEAVEDFVRTDKTNKVANIYSDGMLLSGVDNDFEINGMLPNHFYNPNVYDTACQFSVSCSYTYKYVPFCKQVLNQGNADPIEKFNEIVDAYNEAEL